MSLFHKIFSVTDIEAIANQLEKVKGAAPASPEPEDKRSPSPEEHPYVAQITYLVKLDGNIDVKTSFSTKVQAISPYAVLLYLVTSGNLKNETAEFVLKMVDNPEYTDFITNVLERWEKLIMFKEEVPLVRPLNALKVSKNSLGGDE
jgi:hypothetical protein